MPASVYTTSEVDQKLASLSAVDADLTNKVTSLDDRVTALEEGGVTPEPPQPEPDTEFIPIGVSFGGIGYTDDAAKRGRMMDDLIAMSGRSLRLQWWRQTQCEDAVEQARAKGLSVISTCMPDYSTTVVDRARAKQYGTEWANLLGSLIEDGAFWNEPDLGTPWTPEKWAQACVGFQEGVEASRYPEIRLWVGELWTWKMNDGSTTEGAFAWWQRAYAEWKKMGVNQLPGYGCSGHMYGDMAWNDPRNAIIGYFGPKYDGKDQKCIRFLMDSNGDESKPIIATECGNGNPSAQVAAVNSMFDLESQGHLASFHVYSQWDDAAGTFGMRPAEGQTQRQAYNTYHSRASLPGLVLGHRGLKGGGRMPVRPRLIDWRNQFGAEEG